jgi:branched-subunit amino acid ABC-type transport system permease component
MSQLFLNGLVAGSVAALLGTAFVIVYCGSRFFVFTFAIAYLYGAYGMFLCHGYMPIIVAGPTGVFIAGVVSVLLEAFVYRSIRRDRNNSSILMLASIGAYGVLQNLVSLGFGNATKSVRFWSVNEGRSVLGARITPEQMLIVSVSLVVIALVGVLLTSTSFGRKLRAVGTDGALAHAMGIPVDTTRIVAAGLGGVMAGTAGVLMSLDTDMTPTIGFRAFLLAIVAAIVGGTTSYGGAVAGGLFVGLTLHVGVWKLPTAWQEAILFAVLFAFLVLRPRGFCGKSATSTSV